jgi:hypothetical protein
MRKIFKKYPILRKHPDKLKVEVIRAGRKLSKAQLEKTYDSIYFDKTTVSVHDITEYIVQAGHPQIIPVDLDKGLKAGKKEKNTTFVVSPVKKMRKNGI